ncbi:MAG TPA: amino acid ABC transporter substrate-binding protein [Actinomycetota bacterium]|nr:amino acid ABC transporter substrate-binding protein [Actinomycetota bacterium]
MSTGRWRAVAAVMAIGLVAAACSNNKPNTNASGNQTPIVIGISLSLTGDFSDPGSAAKRGYELWRDTINAHGGLLGRPVELKIVDDTSSPNQVVTNYTTLITKDHVDLVFGAFSTLLNAPAAAVASRNGYAYLEPAGGGPAIFAEGLHNVFFTQPAPVVNSADVFTNYLLSLPPDQLPKTAAYPSLDDPFASPIVDRVRQKLEANGIQTVYKTIYPSESVDMTPIVARIAAANPDLVVAGTQSNDAFAEVKAMVEQKFSPTYLFMTNGANDPVNFPDKVGAGNVSGIFTTGDWYEAENSAGNSEFVAAYHAKYGPGAIDSTSAEAYACGQILQAVAAKLKSLDNAKIIAALHQGSWPSVEGNLSWDSIGQPQGQDLLLEWVGGTLQPVYPPNVAQTAPVIPKPNWGG